MDASSNPDDKNIFGEFWYRFRKPWCLSFALHFVLMIILIGGLGIILSILNYYFSDKASGWSIVENIVSYSLALVIPSTIPILQSFNRTSNKVSLLEITIFLFILVPIGISIVAYCFKIWWLPIVGVIVSWCGWIIANYENSSLNDRSFEETIREGANKHGQNWN